MALIGKLLATFMVLVVPLGTVVTLLTGVKLYLFLALGVFMAVVGCTVVIALLMIIWEDAF